MQISNQDILEGIRQGCSQAMHMVARQITKDAQLYGLYSKLTYDQAIERLQPAFDAIVTSIEISDAKPLRDFIDRVIELRLRSGYDPNVLLRLMNLIAEETCQAANQYKPQDAAFAIAVQRRMTFLNNTCKLHMANLNLTIPLNERTNIDPDLLRSKTVAS